VSTNLQLFFMTQAKYIGEGDFHDISYSNREILVPFKDPKYNLTANVSGECEYTFHVFPTKVFEASYKSNLPFAMTMIVAATFLLMAIAFFGYDWFVQRRNNKVVEVAARHGALVSSLFPKNVRDRLFADAAAEVNNKNKTTEASKYPAGQLGKNGLKSFLANEKMDLRGEDDDVILKTKPVR
jgi:hypothetical protein